MAGAQLSWRPRSVGRDLRPSATNSNELTRSDFGERFENPRREGSEFLDAIGVRKHYDDADTRGLQILLEWEILVDGEQDVESLGQHESQQVAISLAVPAHINNVANIVAFQVRLQRPRNTLIE